MKKTTKVSKVSEINNSKPTVVVGANKPKTKESKMSTKNEVVSIGDQIIINNGVIADKTIEIEGLKVTVVGRKNQYLVVKSDDGEVYQFLADGRTGVVYTKFSRKMRAVEIKEELKELIQRQKEVIAEYTSTIDRYENFKSDAEYALAAEDAAFKARLERVTKSK